MYKVRDLYDQVVTRLQINLPESGVLQPDVIQAISDGVKHIRGQFIADGIVDPFTTTVYVDELTRDDTYLQFYSKELPSPVYKAAPIHSVVFSAFAPLTTYVIEDEPQTFSAGDFAVYDRKLYKAVSSFEDVNTYNKSFSYLQYREYRTKNRVKYFKNDVIYDSETKLYYRFLVDTVMTSSISEHINTGDVEQVYWIEVGNAYKSVGFVSFDQLLLHSAGNGAIFSISDDRVYVTKPINGLTLSYVPEFVEYRELDDDVIIPEVAVLPVITTAMRILTVPLGIQIPDQPGEEVKEEEEEQPDEREESPER